MSKKVYIGGSSADNKDESRPKKRKSKYSDIQGDLSHIWREPKCETSRRQTKKRKYTKRKDGGEEQNNDTDKQKDIKLVRKLIETLKHPKSRQHQEFILALLRIDGGIRKSFMEERAKMGKQTIQVFRRSSSNDDSKYFSNGSEYQNPSTTAQISDQSLHDMHNADMCSASEMNIPEMHGDNTDDLINVFIQSFGKDVCKSSVPDPHTNEARMVFPLLYSNGSEIQNSHINCGGAVNVSPTEATQIDCNGADDILYTMSASTDCNGTGNISYMETSDNEGISSATYGENSTLTFFVDEQQAPSATSFLTQTDTDNPRTQNGCVFDAPFHDDLQNISEDLYHANNVQPNNTLG